jgi:uroporphyrinogen III methyltransferase/synthase
VIECPTIRIEPAADPAALRRAARDARTFDWVIFTSANAAEAFWAALREEGLDCRALGGAKVAAIGPATAERLARFGIVPDVRPAKFTTPALVEELSRGGRLAGKRVLCPRCDIAPRDLIEGLSSAGAAVTEVAAYRTVPDDSGSAEVREMLGAGAIHWLTFTSSSTVDFFVRNVPAAAVAKSGARIASIGPATSSAIRRAGLPVAVEASIATAGGLVSAIMGAERQQKEG